MRFLAYIVTNSAIHKIWSAQKRVSGLLDGVVFRWDGKRYAATEITTEQVAKFRARQDQAVRLETARVLPREAQQVLVRSAEAQPASEPEPQSELPQQEASSEPALRRVRRTKLPE